MANTEVYINFNGNLYLAREPILTYNNRAFAYGDGLFESMHAYACEVPLFSNHFDRLIKGMQTLKMNIPSSFTQEKIHFEIERLLKRNKYFTGTRVKITVFRNSEGLYLPKSDNISYLIESNPLQNKFFKINEKGLTIGIYNELKKPINILSSYKTCNSLFYILAAKYAFENHYDDCLIMNEHNEIIESYHCNIFLVKNNVLYTPPLTSGCVSGIMRNKIIEIARHLNINISDNIKINNESLLNADEIFLTNAVEGIRWVLAFKNRRYFNKLANYLNDTLNTLIFSDKI